MKNRSNLIGAFVALAATTPLAAMAQSSTNPESRIEIGYLDCTLLSKGGNIIKATESFTCIFDPADAEYSKEVYLASVTNWGINLSSITDEKIRWAVLSSAEKYANGVLEGEYAGLSAEVAAGVGVGVNAMIGGFDKSIALQPVSLATQEGIGIAAGVKNLELSFVGDKIE